MQVVDENTHADIYFAGAQYKSLTTKKFYSNQTLIQKRYYLLKTVCKKTVVPIRRWKENATYYIELQDDTDVSDEDMHDDQGTEEERPNDDSSYCFCRQSSDLDDLIECSDANCEIMWFHFKCVGVWVYLNEVYHLVTGIAPDAKKWTIGVHVVSLKATMENA